MLRCPATDDTEGGEVRGRDAAVRSDPGAHGTLRGGGVGLDRGRECGVLRGLWPEVSSKRLCKKSASGGTQPSLAVRPTGIRLSPLQSAGRMPACRTGWEACVPPHWRLFTQSLEPDNDRCAGAGDGDAGGLETKAGTVSSRGSRWWSAGCLSRFSGSIATAAGSSRSMPLR